MPRYSKKTIAAARASLARYHEERRLTHSPRRLHVGSLGMIEARSDGMTWAAFVTAIAGGLWIGQLDVVVAASGVFVAIGVWRFGIAYRDRVERELQTLSPQTGEDADDTAEVEAAIHRLYRDAERMAGRMIIVGTLMGALAPVLWRIISHLIN